MKRGAQAVGTADSGTGARGPGRVEAGPREGPTIADLEQQMSEAVAVLDFEAARCLRDRIGLMRGGATSVEAAAAETSGLTRQQPGRMGLGTSRQRVAPPPGWKAPRKPDLMTNSSRRGGKARPGGPDEQS
jgi:hypothetical protein